VTAALRDETPSFRYAEYACDLTVFVDTYSRSPISWKERCVGSSGSSRSSAAVSADAPTALSAAAQSGRMSRPSYSRQSCEASGQRTSAAHPPGHLAQARISAGRQARSVHSTSTRRRRGLRRVLVAIRPAGIRSATGSAGRRSAESLLVNTMIR
jgi:hypothetical protein